MYDVPASEIKVGASVSGVEDLPETNISIDEISSEPSLSTSSALKETSKLGEDSVAVLLTTLDSAIGA